MSVALPDLYLFNPTCDIAVGNDAISYTPARGLLQFEADMAAMPLWLSRETDLVLVPGAISTQFIDLLHHCHLPVPRFITYAEWGNKPLPIHRFLPWGWSKATHHDFNDVKRLCADAFQISPVASWTHDHRMLFSRLTALDLANALRPVLHHHRVIQLPSSARVIRHRDEALRAIDDFKGQLIFKAPWSSSGRGLMMVDDAANRFPDMRWVEGTIRQQGFLMAEPFLQKVHDLSFHFYIHPTGDVSYLGHNFFHTNDKGKFTGCVLEAFPHSCITRSDGERLTQAIGDVPGLLLNALQQLNLHRLYSGPVGVDALWYLDADGQSWLHPVVETNIRYTMGLLNISLRQRLHANATGRWYMEQYSSADQLNAFWDRQLNENPIVVEEGRLIKGFLPLVPGGQAWGAWLFLQ